MPPSSEQTTGVATQCRSTRFTCRQVTDSNRWLVPAPTIELVTAWVVEMGRWISMAPRKSIAAETDWATMPRSGSKLTRR